MLFAYLLLFLGLIALSITFLPFSPMTIDIVNLRRESQLAIHRQRHRIWVFAGACWGTSALWTLVTWQAGTAEVGAFPLVFVATGTTVAFLFWSGYVPLVMSPPGRVRRLSAAEATTVLTPEETVLGVALDGRACAYRRDQIARPHYFVDDLAGERILVSYCILCNSAIAFKPRLGERTLDLRCVTAFNNNIIYFDAASGNYIQQLDAKVIDGPDRGTRLELVPVTVTSWGDWLALYPTSDLYDAPAISIRDRLVAYMLDMLIPVHKLARRERPWHRVRGVIDRTLPAMAFVLGIERNGEAVAYAYEALRHARVIIDRIGDEAVILLHDGRRDFAGVYARTLDGKDLDFEPISPANDGRVARDLDTGSLWNAGGQAIAGPHLGARLPPLPHFNRLFWFSWILFKPHTRVFHTVSSPTEISRFLS